MQLIQKWREPFLLFFSLILGFFLIEVGFRSLMTVKSKVGNSFPKPISDFLFSTHYYGQSLEAKVEKYLSDPSLHMDIGWIKDGLPPVALGNLDRKDISLYGLSYTEFLSRALSKQHPELGVQFITGGLAPPSHTYAIIQEKIAKDPSSVIVFTVFSYALHRCSESVACMTCLFHTPCFYTYPKYHYENMTLVPVSSGVQSLLELKTVFSNPELRENYLDFLEENDGLMNHFLLRKSVADFFSPTAFLRKKLYEGKVNETLSRYEIADKKWKRDANPFHVLPGVLSSFLNLAKKQHKTPVIFFLEEQRFAGYFDPLILGLGEENKKYTFQTSRYIDVNDARIYKSDRHFKDEVDEQLAKAFYLKLKELHAF